MTAQTCPHCSAPARGDGRPACLCAAAGAEDFDPLRIRPYVSLTGRDAQPDSAGRPNGSGQSSGASTGTDSSAPGAPPTVPRPRRPGPTSRTFTASWASPAAPDDPVTPVPPRKRALSAALAATGAAVAAAAVLIGSEALSGGGRDRAAPPDRGTAAPTTPSPASDSPEPSGTGSLTGPPTRHAPAPHPSSRPAPRKTYTLYRTPAPRPPAPTRAAGSVGHAPGGPTSAPPTGPIVLREGSSGPEVAELQNRLRQLGRYPGLTDGRYDAEVRAAVSRYQEAYGVTGDPDGVYGAGTRSSLESQTREP
ncbi:peptidoglycan-binding domain-containing protein [Streptomyces chattanoogensis]|uniref:peptidoglycan-binding domain-containing protein n=1 Tax=Streptomyces chattanoogensis TaxID=66876 RepID=UPI000A6169D1|nr:peptidoglycan-binding domain-containing protein [Streptomyces chattanoogensis]